MYTEKTKVVLDAAQQDLERARAAEADAVTRAAAARHELAALDEEVGAADPEKAAPFKALVERRTIAGARVDALEKRVASARAELEVVKARHAGADREHRVALLADLNRKLETQAGELRARAAAFEAAFRSLWQEHLDTYAEAAAVARGGHFPDPTGTFFAPQPAIGKGGWWDTLGTALRAATHIETERTAERERESARTPATSAHLRKLVEGAKQWPLDVGGDGPRYLVTMPPGAPLTGRGFVEVGQFFTAPADYVPSRTFLPCNVEAAQVLERLYGIKREPASPLAPAAAASLLDRHTGEGFPPGIDSGAAMAKAARGEAVKTSSDRQL